MIRLEKEAADVDRQIQEEMVKAEKRIQDLNSQQQQEYRQVSADNINYQKSIAEQQRELDHLLKELQFMHDASFFCYINSTETTLGLEQKSRKAKVDFTRRPIE